VAFWNRRHRFRSVSRVVCKRHDLLPFAAGFATPYFTHRLRTDGEPEAAERRGGVIVWSASLAVALIIFIWLPWPRRDWHLVRRFPKFLELARGDINSLKVYCHKSGGAGGYAKLRRRRRRKAGRCLSHGCAELLRVILGGSLSVFKFFPGLRSEIIAFLCLSDRHRIVGWVDSGLPRMYVATSSATGRRCRRHS